MLCSLQLSLSRFILGYSNQPSKTMPLLASLVALLSLLKVTGASFFPGSYHAAACESPRFAHRLDPQILSMSREDGQGGGNDNDGLDDEKRRMSDVRAVQNMFYSSATGSSGDSKSLSPRLDYETGIFFNLPLWREKMGYTELPGRSLIGFVKDPSYTHMFETLLRSRNENMYFGQLRLDNVDVGINVNAASNGSSRSSSSGQDKNPPPRPHETDMNAPLYSWKDCTNDHDAVVVGTLMRINDHIRLDDGRLMLLLHAMERFVVMEPKRKLPYAIADVMMLPDEEEIIACDNNFGYAVEQNFRRWSHFEYDDSIRFPIERHGENDGGIMSLNDVLLAGGEAFGSLLPFVPYSSQYSKAEEASAQSDPCIDCFGVTDGYVSDLPTYPCFSELVEKDIIREVESFSLERVANRSNPSNMPDADEIERDLWILIDEYVQLRGVTNVFPKHLLGLLPKNIVWPDNFALEKLANIYSGMALVEEGRSITENKLADCDELSFCRVMDRIDYPNQRRQKRLSYACIALLGGPVNDHPLLNRTMRRRLLEVPSTTGRLWAARELFDAYNSQFRKEL